MTRKDPLKRNTEVDVLYAEARELEERIAENVTKILESA